MKRGSDSASQDTALWLRIIDALSLAVAHFTSHPVSYTIYGINSVENKTWKE